MSPVCGDGPWSFEGRGDRVTKPTAAPPRGKTSRSIIIGSGKLKKSTASANPRSPLPSRPALFPKGKII